MNITIGATLVLLFAAAAASAAGEAVVAASGAASLKRQPDRLRAALQLAAEGTDTKDALAKLAEQRTAVKAKLAALGALADTVEFSDARPAPLDQRTERYQAMIRNGFIGSRRGSAMPAPTTGPVPVRLAINLCAEWAIKAEGIEQLLIESEALRQKIRAADLAGRKPNRPLTPEEQEVREEMDGLNPALAAAAEPQFLFVSRLSPDDLAKARSEAFAKARQHAAQLAKAAGMELGDLREVSGLAWSGGGEPAAEIETYDTDWPRWGGSGRPYVRARPTGPAPDGPAEGVSPEPGMVQHQVTIRAVFQMK